MRAAAFLLVVGGLVHSKGAHAALVPPLTSPTAGLPVVLSPVWSETSTTNAAAAAASVDTPADESTDKPTDKPTETMPPVLPVPLDSTDEVIKYFFSGVWLDPQGPAWAPRRGARTDLSISTGFEAPVGDVFPAGVIPPTAGSTMTTEMRFFPLERTAVVVGGRGYFGLDSTPAAGTTAATVLSPFMGMRSELVRENRFTLSWDLHSGPAFFVFGEFADAFRASWALGAELGTALDFSYSLGPICAEGRLFVGGRAGSLTEFGATDAISKPFSTFYGGGDLGLTWTPWLQEE